MAEKSPISLNEFFVEQKRQVEIAQEVMAEVVRIADTIKERMKQLPQQWQDRIAREMFELVAGKKSVKRFMTYTDQMETILTEKGIAMSLQDIATEAYLRGWTDSEKVSGFRQTMSRAPAKEKFVRVGCGTYDLVARVGKNGD